VDIIEHVFVIRDVRPNKIIRPFLISSGVNSQSYSLKLQRILTDFGADASFANAAKKAAEHYGIDVPISGIRNTVLKHANEMLVKNTSELNNMRDVYSPIHRKALTSGVKQIITQTDGSMVPIVTHSSTAKDNRKKKIRSYQEARLCLSYAEGSVTPVYAATMSDVNTTGKYMRQTALSVGLGNNTKVHAVGDGAQWIKNQLDDKFGDISTVNYLIDLFHMGEYISDASTVIITDENKRLKWVKRQLNLLKRGQINKVLTTLEPFKNAPEDNPAMHCYRYITNRLTQLDYKSAIEQELPIGSGLVEGGHRYVIQARMKISGAAWVAENVNPMLALRTNRINGQWDGYWDKSKNQQI